VPSELILGADSSTPVSEILFPELSNFYFFKNLFYFEKYIYNYFTITKLLILFVKNKLGCTLARI
jgi:hypothetical protein